MVRLKKNTHDAPPCVMCTLHVMIVLCLTVSTRGLHMAQAHATVEIFPVEHTFLAGSNFTLTCTIAQSSTILAEDIKWSRDGVTLPPELHSTLDDKTSQLKVQSAEFQDSGLYACVVEKSLHDEGNQTRVYVGVPPTGAEDLSCSSHDFFDVTCKWEQGSYTNINTTDTLQYFKKDQWDNCRKENCECSDKQTCTLLGFSHLRTRLRVITSNTLGHAFSAELTFYLEDDTVLYPPRNVTAKAITGLRLRVTWTAPKDIKLYVKYVDYKMEYYKEGSSVLMEAPDMKQGQTYTVLSPNKSLDAYTTYCVRVAGQFSDGPWSDWSEEACSRTLENKPNAKVNASWSSKVNAKNDSLRDVLLEWEPLSKAIEQGIILGYNVIRVNGTIEMGTTPVNVSKTSLEIKGLERYADYRYAIEAFNSVGASPRRYLEIFAEHKPTHSVALTIVAILVSAVFLGFFAFSWYCIKRYRLLKPVPNISIIALDKFERAISRSARRGVAEREVFDELWGHHTPNGIIPNGTIPNATIPGNPRDTADCNAEDSKADYVRLRNQAHAEESFPLLHSNSGVESCTEKSNPCRKLSQASTDSANSSRMSSDRDPDSPGSTVAPYLKFAKLYIQMPPPVSSDRPRSGLGQPRLDSTDSGFGENCIEYRMPNYTKLSTIPSHPGITEVPVNGEQDDESDDHGGDFYHCLGNSEPAIGNLKPSEDQSYEPDHSKPRVPSYTRLSSIPCPLVNGKAPSVDEHVTISDGTAPSCGNLELGIV